MDTAVRLTLGNNRVHNKHTQKKKKRNHAMENQHEKISGYRSLTQAEIDLMNEIKAKGEELKVLVNKVKAHITNDLLGDPNERLRWGAIGRTNYQQGLMAITRAVAAPNFE